MTALTDLLVEKPLPSWYRLSWLVMALLCCFVVWASLARLDEVALAAGEVVPQSNVRTLQHFEGGMIAEILVRDNQPVTAGQVLMVLDLSATESAQADAQVQLDSLQLKRARLRAEADGVSLNLPPEVAQRRADLARAEQETYESRQAQLRNSLDGLNSQLRQRELESDQLRAKLKALTADLALARERLGLSRRLLEQQLVPRLEHLTVEREVETLEGDLKSLQLSVPRSLAAQDEIRGRIGDVTLKFRREALEDLRDIEPNLSRQQELLSVTTSQANRAQLISPVDGIVKDLRYHTVGGVVRPGEPILNLVPSNDRLVVQCRLSPTDRGYVQVGQPALVKVSAYDYFRFGGLTGRVRDISPDTSQVGSGPSYFTVIVETDEAQLERDGESFPISTGMQAVVEIRTGERSLLHYLLKPMLRLQAEGFRER